MDNMEEVGKTNQGFDGSEKLLNSSVCVDDNNIKQLDMRVEEVEGGSDKDVTVENVDSKKNNGSLVKSGMNDHVKSSNKKYKGIILKPSFNVKHVLTEKKRRKKMKDLFEELANLLPNQPTKASMTTIIEETINRIQTLKETIHDLELRKVEKINVGSPAKYTPFPFHLHSQPFFKTWTTPNVTLNMCRLEAHISITSPKKPGLATAIFGVLAKRKIDVLHAQIISVRSRIMIKIHARVNVAPDELLMGPISYENLFKQAGLEIMYWANSRSSSDA